MLTIIVFSKDRPLQLDLALKSIKKNIQITNTVHVIYGCSNSEYFSAYDRLICEHKDVAFINDDINDFGNYVYKIASSKKDLEPFLMFMTDDNIVYRESATLDIDLRNIFTLNIASLSLRLGLNITRTDSKLYPLPSFTQSKGVHLVWNRMRMLAGSYWNYPLSVDGHIFKKDLILPILKEIFIQGKLTHPNELEKMLQRYFFEVPMQMACEVHSCIVNSPNNRVQDLCKNWFGLIFPARPNELLIQFNHHKRIDIDKLKFDVVCPHQEINILEGLE